MSAWEDTVGNRATERKDAADQGSAQQPVDGSLSGMADLPRGLRRSLRRYQVIAYVVGVWLLLLCGAMVAKYGFHSEGPMRIIGPAHGFGYMIYLVLAFDLTRQVGWNLKRTLGVLLAGTVPFLSFVVERAVSRTVIRGD